MSSDVPVIKIISVLVSIKFEINYFSISFYTVSELFLVLVSIKLLSVPLLYHSMGQIIKSVFLSVCVCMYLWARLRSHFSTDLYEIW